jgi:tight adherence protein C
MLDFLLLFLLAGFVTTLLAGILLTIFKKHIAFNERVDKYFADPVKKQKDDFLNDSNKKSLKMFIYTYWNKGTEILNKKVSTAERKKIETLLRDAGNPFKSAIDFRLFQIVLSICLALPVFLFVFPTSDNKMLTLIMVFILGFLGLRLPIFYLGKKNTARIKAINVSMPDFFDTVNLLLEAGMGLDLALVEVSKKVKGPLADEFIQTLEDMKLGKSRRDAFYALRKRVPSDSFQSVITSLIQADQMGIGMAKALSNLTVRIREKRREAAREQAMKAPVKMLFPMVFFIFPSLFIVILGPLAITLITKGFGG